MWSSPNKYAVFAVVAHFVQQIEVQGKPLYRNKAILLGMKRMKGRHSADEMAEEIIKLILDYEIRQQLGCFQADNPAYNDNTVRDVLSRVEPSEHDWPSRRVCCLGHIVNLAARDFILGQDGEAFEFAIAGAARARFDKPAMEKAQELWRRKGSIGKLHNVVAYIRGSAQCTEAFRKISVEDSNVDGK